jgi:predicted O-methyltransferase YrrM
MNISTTLTQLKDKIITETDRGDMFLTDEVPSVMEYEEYYRPGTGTENVGGLLRSLVQMVRPNHVLEIGAGYTTPHLLEALVNNSRVYNDGNLNPSYFDNLVYDPKLVIIDNMSRLDSTFMHNIGSSDYVEFVNGNFQDHAKMLEKKYQHFDFVWFDCGGPAEYQDFVQHYWHMCSSYVLFHFTYTNGSPNDNYMRIMESATDIDNVFHIVEPHKNTQGSVTMIKKRIHT